MGALVGLRGQVFADRLYDASGTIATGGTAQLVLPFAKVRTSLIIENLSDTNMFLEFGSGRATATLTSGVVSSVAVTNAGFGFSRPPKVYFLGGAWDSQSPIPTSTVRGNPCGAAPSNVAQATCVMSGSAPNMTIGSITIDNPGSGYVFPPYVLLVNDLLDPFGCAAPSATVGLLLLSSGGSYTSNGSLCTTDQISIFCSGTGKAFTCKFSL